MLKKILKIIGWSFLTVFVVVVLVGLFSQTGLFKSWVRDTIVKQANSSLNARLSIAKIDGNLVQSFAISNIALFAEKDTLLTVANVFVKIQPIQLLFKRIVVDVVAVENLNLYLKEMDNGGWDLQNLTKQDAEKDTTTVESIPFNWTVIVENVQLQNFNAFINSSRSTVPQSVQDFNASLSLTVMPQGLYVHLQDLSCKALTPDFELSSLSFYLSRESEKIKLERLRLQTPNSLLAGEAEFILDEKPNFNFSVNSDSLALWEIDSFLNAGLPKISPQIKLSGQLKENQGKISLLIIENSEKIELSGGINGPFEKPQFDLTLRLEKFNLSNWVDAKNYLNKISGEIKTSGVGNSFKDFDAKINANIFNASFKPALVDSFVLNGHVTNKMVNAKLALYGMVGNITAAIQAKDIQDKPAFKTRLSGNHINLSPIVSNPTFNSNLNFNIDVLGVGAALDELKAKLTFQMLPSTLTDFSINALDIEAEIENGDYIVDNLSLILPCLTAYASGAGNFQSVRNSDVKVELGDLNDVQHLFGLDSLAASGFLTTQIQGPFDSLAINVFSSLKDIRFNDVDLKLFNGRMRGVLNKKQFWGNSQLFLKDGAFQNISLDTLNVSANVAGTQIAAKVNLAANDSLSLFLDGTANIDSTTHMSINKMDLVYGQQKWQSVAQMGLDISSKTLNFENFKFENQNQKLSVNGIVNLDGDLNLQIHSYKLLIGPLLKLSGVDIGYPLNGLCDLDAYLFGSAKNPEITAQLLLQNLQIRGQAFPELKLNSAYSNKILDIQSILKHNNGGQFEINGELPFFISFVDSSTLLNKDDPVSVTVKAKDFDIAFLSALAPGEKKINGKLDIDLNVKSILPLPMISGTIKLNNGGFAENQFGLDYKNIILDLIFLDDILSVKEFSADAGPGKITATGNASFEKGKYLSGPKDIYLALKGTDTQLAKSPAVEMIANSNIILQGNPESIKFGGKVEILRSRMNIAELKSGQDQTAHINKSRLVQALGDTIKIVQQKAPTEKINMQNLTGKLTLSMPRNTWVRSKDMNIEMSGDLLLVKEGPFFELFGNVQTVRGTYNLYGRRFNIKQGQITFRGGKEVNPQINLEADYSFRNIEADKTTLTLKTSGTLLKPELSFLLNDSPIEEADGISYILFGKNSNDLSRGQKSDMSQSGGSSAQLASVLSGRVTGQLTKAIQNTFSLDVMEFRGGSNWRQASIIIGKYLTNNLFMAYEREFNVGGSQDVIPEKVSLEYEITPRIFIQATEGDDKSSGFDVIWKIEKK